MRSYIVVVVLATLAAAGAQGGQETAGCEPHEGREDGVQERVQEQAGPDGFDRKASRNADRPALQCGKAAHRFPGRFQLPLLLRRHNAIPPRARDCGFAGRCDC